MGYIESIKIKESLNNYISNNSDILNNISKLNIFVGGNNSGKSRFLREVFSDSDLTYNINHEKIIEYNDLIKNLNNEIKACFNGGITGIESISSKSNLFTELKCLNKESNVLEEFNEKINTLLSFDENKEYSYTSSSVGVVIYEKKEIIKNLREIGERYNNEFKQKKLDKFFKKRELDKIYIPILRGLRSLGSERDLFKERTINDYFEENSETKIFTGQHLYDDVLKLLCGDYKDRVHLREFELFLGDNFFDGKNISLIPKIKSDVLYVKIGDEKEYPIYELGDGIQSIIILTFNLYANKGKNMLFFIEEPELYLHPGLQRKLLEVFLSDEFDTYQYFVTSHSNHLLDLSLDIDDISVYKFMKNMSVEGDEEKQATFSIENVKNDDVSLLEILGVNNSSIFLSNCTIWVEGITDRLYIRKYLEIYQNEKFKNEEIEKIYLEDLHYSFLEYSGGNITHWDFLDDTDGDLSSMKHSRICTSMFLLADSDGYNDYKEGVKRERLNKLSDYFKEKFYCLKAKEIENILKPNVIKNVVTMFKYGKENKDAELFNKVDFSENEYKNKNIGEFIDNKIDEQIDIEKVNDEKFDYERKKTFKKGSTVSDKVKFCKYSIENIKTLDDMSEEAIEICEKLYNFIKENNS